MLRQQSPIADGRPNRSLADFVLPLEPKRPRPRRRVRRHGRDSAPTRSRARFEAEKDDYNAIMVKALADRLAEAFAEWLHARCAAEWGYGAGEHLGPDDLAAERYRGIRPAFGYPACPDHSEKFRLFDLLEAGRSRARRSPRARR